MLPSLPQKRKKDGAYPFARLSLASAGCLAGEAVGRFAGNRKKDRGPEEGRSRTRGESCQVPRRTSLSPSPKAGAAQTLRTSGPLRFSRRNRLFASGRPKGRKKCTQF